MIELLSIDLSNYCSKQCAFCYNHSRKDGNVMWTATEVIAFASDCVRSGVQAISLGGGEPFEYEGVFKIIDAIGKIAYISVTSNGIPLMKEEVWQQLMAHKPDKVHISIHNADNAAEVERTINLMGRLQEAGVKPGVNLLVPASKVEHCRKVYAQLLGVISSDQIILIPQKYSDMPTPKQLSIIANGKPFQSPSCLLGCKMPENFASVSWDKKVNHCSYAGGKQPLKSLDFLGLVNALEKVEFKTCLSHKA